ncbi:MAG: hypothetical protein P1S59_03680 [bacterium]|nr:hypothetical protein [bacterium]
MKKLSIILLALALALVFTVPAMAIHIGDDDSPEGSIGFTGRYQFDGESRDYNDVKNDFFDDDLDVSITMIQGGVKGFVGLEIADTPDFAGNSHVNANVSNIVDNYYVEWSAMDNLKVKIGEYGLAFGRAIGTDSAGERQIQVTYSMDAVSISGALMKAVDGGEDEDDTLYLKLSAKEAGPFTKLDVVSYSEMNDVTVPENSYTGLDLAVPVGPVGVAFEYGANGGDLDGNFMLLELALDDLVGFELGVNYFASSDDYSAAYDGSDWSPVAIYGDNINSVLADATALWLTFGYSVNDKLSLNAAALLMTENDVGDDLGTEFDVGLKYKLADNVSYAAKYGSYTEGDAPIGDWTEMWHRIEFKF